MAETQEIAQKDFDLAVTNLNTAQETLTTAETAHKANTEDTTLKTAFDEAQTAFDTVQTTHGTAKVTLEKFSKEGYWPSDWREKYINDQSNEEGDSLSDKEKEKLRGRLSRYASPRAALDAMLAGQDKLRSGKLKAPLSEKPTDAELIQYRKDNSIPEKAEDYSLTLGDGMVVGENDKEMVTSFSTAAHEMNLPQDKFTEVLSWYYKNSNELITKLHESDETYKEASIEELREEYGSEFKPNMNAIENYFAEAPEGLYSKFRTARIDGIVLGNMPDMIRFFSSKAREANPASTLVPGSGIAQLDTITNEIESLESKMGTPEWFKDEKSQKRYLSLVDARDKISKKNK